MASAATRLLWQLFFPGMPAEVAGYGIPAEVLIRAHEDPSRLVLHIRLVGLEEAPADLAPPAMPEDYRGATVPLKEHSVPVEPSAVADEHQSGRRTATERPTLVRAATSDAAWAVRQSTLTTLKDLINVISSHSTRSRGWGGRRAAAN